MDYLTYIFAGILILCTVIKLWVEINKIGLRQYIINCIAYAEKNIIYGENEEKI